MARGSNPGVDATCGLSLLFVLSLALRGFSPGTLFFLKNQHFQIPIRAGRTSLRMCYLEIVIYLFIVFLKEKNRKLCGLWFLLHDRILLVPDKIFLYSTFVASTILEV